MLRQALASPWSAERSLRGLLQASLADALDALGDRAGAARALQSALADVQEKDVYGLCGYLHAMRALLLAAHLVISAVRKAELGVPMAVLSACGAVDDVISCLRASTDDYISLPAEPEQILDVLKRVLAAPTVA